MDIFLVPDESEVDQPASQYREQVVRIAGLGITPAGAPNAALFSRASFGFAEDEHIYLAAQQLQKWTPDFIDAVIQILAADSRGKLVYFALDWGLSTRAFELMLRNKFNLAGLDYGARVAVVGQLSRDNYFALLQAVDVSLDTFGFSGGSTTLDAAAIGLAVVNLKGNFLRGRQSAAILERAGQRCNVVTDVGAFVARAIAITKAKRLSTTQDSKLSPPTGVTRRNEAQVYESFADYLMREIVGRHDLFAIAGAP